VSSKSSSSGRPFGPLPRHGRRPDYSFFIRVAFGARAAGASCGERWPRSPLCPSCTDLVLRLCPSQVRLSVSLSRTLRAGRADGSPLQAEITSPPPYPASHACARFFSFSLCFRTGTERPKLGYAQGPHNRSGDGLGSNSLRSVCSRLSQCPNGLLSMINFLSIAHCCDHHSRIPALPRGTKRHHPTRHLLAVAIVGGS
jgi:hypothetical protein